MGRKRIDRIRVHILNDFREKVFHTGERHPRELVFSGGVSLHWGPWLDKPFFAAALGALGSALPQAAELLCVHRVCYAGGNEGIDIATA